MKDSCKLRVLENFAAIDYVCFGDELKKRFPVVNQDIREYLELKGALCNILFELYNMVECKPPMPKEKIGVKELYEVARENAQIARKNAKTILESDKGRKFLNLKVGENVETFNEIETTEIVDYTIHEKAVQVALDNLLIARMINESANIDKLKDFEGVVMEDAYKTLRNGLVEKAIQIMSNATN